MASHTISIVLLVLGFGFVIFFHELGHFLAAKYVGVRVEQFAVGFGQALLAWRKGIGFRIGTTTPVYEMRIIDAYRARHIGAALADDVTVQDIPVQEREAIIAKLGLGDTEYRLNWIPLGGYVKMLGQDDLRPNADADDPRAYNRKSIGSRMLVVSAGVIMNVILAIIGFMIVFRIGFNAPPATVGTMLPGSPAQTAGLHVGDSIVRINGRYQSNFTSILLNIALLPQGQSTEVVVRRDGQEVPLQVLPRHTGGEVDVLAIGVEPIRQLTGLPADEAEVEDRDKIQNMLPADVLGTTPGSLLIEPGDKITAVDGKPVGPNDYPTLNAAMQQAPGQGVQLTITSPDGKTHTGRVYGEFLPPFDQPTDAKMPDIAFGGLVPRARIEQVEPESPALGKLMPGDAIATITVDKTTTVDPTPLRLRDVLKSAADNGQTLSMTVERDGKMVALDGLSPTMRLGSWYQFWKSKGLGVAPAYDEAHSAIGQVLPDSPAAKAGIPDGATITSIAGAPVNSFYDIQHFLGQAQPGEPIDIEFVTSSEANHGVHQQGSLIYHSTKMTLDSEQIAAAHDMLYANNGLLSMLSERITPIKEPNVFAAAWRGLVETRDFMLQFYISIRRMLGGSISPSGLSGPIGIFKMGVVAAYRGTDWLIWFLSMISVNLAVVNFLPIPIVDGGLFTFLIIEKLHGKPISPRVTAIAQYVGLAFLVGVFLFVTYHDILR
jgi:regulator of sigma E protease